MNLELLINSKLLIAIVSAICGIIGALIVQKILNRRSLFTYYVFHNRIGLSAEDEIYGSVKVTWNNNSVANLYLSTVELINESAKDFESIVARIYTDDTILLTERTEIIGTTRIVDYTEDYKKKIEVKNGTQPNDYQMKLYRSQRDYNILTMNRGQKIRFEYLNSAKNGKSPTIWLEIVQKGIKCKFMIARQLFMGVSQQDAVLIGTVICFISIILLSYYFSNIWLVGILSYIIGVTVLIPGVFFIKLLKKIRLWFNG